MKIWTDKDYPIIISCARNLVQWTQREVTAMGLKIIDSTDTTVVVRGSMHEVFRLNLCLRTAHRVLVPLLRFTCRNVRDVYNKAVTIDWENILESDGYFSVSSIVFNRTIRDNRLPSLVLKDAVCDRMREKCARRPDSGPLQTGAALFLHWEHDTALIYIDTSGTPLSKRGYRKIPGSAPMQETLAAACIMAAGWNPQQPFISPMCGSGTPAIEAAMIALNRQPGTLRSHFAFMSLKGWHDLIDGEKAELIAPRQSYGASPEQIWKNMVRKAELEECPEIVPPIIATDISPEAISNAQINANAAGVNNLIKFSACDFADTPIPPAEGGLVFFNPEYGIRLGNPDELAPMYERIGTFLNEKCCDHYDGAVLTGNPDLARCVPLYYSHRVPFFNGPIDCRLFIYPACHLHDAKQIEV